MKEEIDMLSKARGKTSLDKIHKKYIRATFNIFNNCA